jgi:hypothetical protein
MKSSEKTNNCRNIPVELVCKKCGKRYEFTPGYNPVTKKRNSRNYISVCNSCHTNSKRFERKRRMIEYKGGKCQLCGYNKCDRALVFHHLNPNIKQYRFAGNHARKWETMKLELDKCILLCQNCHCEVHEGLRIIPARYELMLDR